METLKKVKQFDEKGFVCPVCGEKGKTILRWETASVPYEYDFKNKRWKMGDDIQGGDFEAWSCPSCGNDILLPRKLIKLIE